jgi:hypothetical protein
VRCSMNVKRSKNVLFSIPETVNDRLNRLSKETGQTKSSMVLMGLNLYFLLYHGNSEQANTVLELINKNQTTIDDFLDG